MKRRGFLAALGFGAVAGPTVGKELASSALSNEGLSSSSIFGNYISSDALSASKISGGWISARDEDYESNLLKDIADAQRWLSGGLTDKEREAQEREEKHIRNSHKDTDISILRSVSSAHKKRMQQRYLIEQKRESEHYYKKNTLRTWLESLKKIGSGQDPYADS